MRFRQMLAAYVACRSNPLKVKRSAQQLFTRIVCGAA
jgi:hypothetical protein